MSGINRPLYRGEAMTDLPTIVKYVEYWIVCDQCPGWDGPGQKPGYAVDTWKEADRLRRKHVRSEEHRGH